MIVANMRAADFREVSSRDRVQSSETLDRNRGDDCVRFQLLMKPRASALLSVENHLLSPRLSRLVGAPLRR